MGLCALQGICMQHKGPAAHRRSSTTHARGISESTVTTLPAADVAWRLRALSRWPLPGLALRSGVTAACTRFGAGATTPARAPKAGIPTAATMLPEVGPPPPLPRRSPKGVGVGARAGPGVGAGAVARAEPVRLGPPPLEATGGGRAGALGRGARPGCGSGGVAPVLAGGARPGAPELEGALGGAADATGAPAPWTLGRGAPRAAPAGVVEPPVSLEGPGVPPVPVSTVA